MVPISDHEVKHLESISLHALITVMSKILTTTRLQIQPKYYIPWWWFFVQHLGTTAEAKCQAKGCAEAVLFVGYEGK